MTPHEKKLLLLADGSARSRHAVRYVADFIPPDKFQVTLFHVYDPVPECYWDLEHHPEKNAAVQELRSWEKQKKKNIEDFMESARKDLVNSGFDSSAITVKIKNRREGIARDIVVEAKAYDAVAMARHGFGAIGSLSIGSVASKLFSKISGIPLIITGDFPEYKKILLAVDGSESSEKMAAFVGDCLAGSDHEILLFHVIRGFDVAVPQHPNLMIPTDRFEMARLEMTAFFSELKELMARNGLDPQKISEKIVSGEFSRAGAIIREARENECSAVAVSRRGISNIEAFLMGRVSNKVIHGGSHFAVWVV